MRAGLATMLLMTLVGCNERALPGAPPEFSVSVESLSAGQEGPSPYTSTSSLTLTLHAVNRSARQPLTLDILDAQLTWKGASQSQALRLARSPWETTTAVAPGTEGSLSYWGTALGNPGCPVIDDVGPPMVDAVRIALQVQLPGAEVVALETTGDYACGYGQSAE